MLKKIIYFVCMLGLFCSPFVYAKTATITSNDGTPIREFLFYISADFKNGKSYPVTNVSESNVTAIVPFPSSIQSGGPFQYTYDIKTLGLSSTIYAWIENTTTANGVEIGMDVGDEGTLKTTCISGPQATIYLRSCEVKIANGVATMNVYLQSK